MALIGTKTGYGVLKRLPGVAPKVREELLQMQKAMSGDIVLSCSLATFGDTATTATEAWTKTTTWKLKSADGKLHDWFCGHMTALVADDATTGIVNLTGGVNTSVFFNGGVAELALVSTTGPLNTAVTCSLRVWNTNLLGNPVTTVAFVVTFA